MPIATSDQASNALIRKLEVAHNFTVGDRAVLTEVCGRSRRVEARQDIIRYGDRPSDVHLVLDGFAHRYKMMPEGNRQILAVLVPGDFCDLHVAVLREMDHSIGALTDCTVVDIPVSTICAVTEHHPRITRALWWATLVDEGVLRAWLANIGQREAPERMAHFFCEMLVRLGWIGMTEADAFDLPLTQDELGDVLGMTSVHANRTLRDLREAQLITLQRRRLTILNVDRLKAFCAFDPAYLHAGPQRAKRYR